MSRPTIVVTGASGFVGAHVAAEARAGGARVVAIGRESEPSSALAPHSDRYLSADLEHEWPVDEPVDAVIHLAGLAAVGPSFGAPQRYLTVNSGIMTTMCEALLQDAPGARVVVVSSGAVYSPPEGPEPLHETDPVVPNSPYAVAKILVETQAAYYAGRGLDTVVARPFNHIGPGQSLGFLVPDLTNAIESLPEGDPLLVGNLGARRDFTDVRDVARAYLVLANAPEHREAVYNVASGAAHSGREVLAAIAEVLDRDVPPIEVDPRRLRPGDPARIAGSSERLRSEFGWSPTIDWRRSIEDYIASR